MTRSAGPRRSGSLHARNDLRFLSTSDQKCYLLTRWHMSVFWVRSQRVTPLVSFFLTTKIMNIDEETQETPLLTENAGKKQATALPWSQLIIVMFLQLAEPLTSHAISPFTPEVFSLIFFTYHVESLLINESQSLFVILASPTVTRAKWDIMSVSWCVNQSSWLTLGS